MDMAKGPAAPQDGTPDPDIPAFEQLAADPEIAALLGFEPVPMRKKVNGWDPDAQRAFVALLAMTGSKLRAARAIGRKPAGIDHILTKPEAAGFGAAIDGAMALAAKRNGMAIARGVAAAQKAEPTVQAPGQVMNEYGEWEDEDSYARRAGEAQDNICGKLVRARRLYLMSISNEPVKRAAFEILTELTVLAPDQSVTVQASSLRSKSKNTPFDGWTLRGGVAATIVGGRIVFASDIFPK